jgi:hypothetical protein
MISPIDYLISKADLKCTVCDTPQSKGCDCWTKCAIRGCRWSYRTGEKCGNPEHKKGGE